MHKNLRGSKDCITFAAQTKKNGIMENYETERIAGSPFNSLRLNPHDHTYLLGQVGKFDAATAKYNESTAAMDWIERNRQNLIRLTAYRNVIDFFVRLHLSESGRAGVFYTDNCQKALKDAFGQYHLDKMEDEEEAR